MIRVYLLDTIIEGGAEAVLGTDLIHDALLQVTETPGVRRLIMDTTETEHETLQALALQVLEPTQAELELYHALVIIFQKDNDTLRAEELLHQSPPSITMVEIWELLRIYGRRHGYSF